MSKTQSSINVTFASVFKMSQSFFDGVNTTRTGFLHSSESQSHTRRAELVKMILPSCDSTFDGPAIW